MEYSVAALLVHWIWISCSRFACALSLLTAAAAAGLCNNNNNNSSSSTSSSSNCSSSSSSSSNSYLLPALSCTYCCYQGHTIFSLYLSRSLARATRLIWVATGNAAAAAVSAADADASVAALHSFIANWCLCLSRCECLTYTWRSSCCLPFAVLVLVVVAVIPRDALSLLIFDLPCWESVVFLLSFIIKLCEWLVL